MRVMVFGKASAVGGTPFSLSSVAKRIVFDGPGRTVIDGPFAES